MGNRGFTLIEILVVVSLMGILASIAIPAYSEHRTKAHTAVALSECRVLYTAFETYSQERGGYPPASGPDQFDLGTFAPLTDRQLYNGGILNELLNTRADGYDSPNQGEFWLQMTLKADPTIQFLVSKSDAAPLAAGKRLEGIFIFRNGVLSNR